MIFTIAFESKQGGYCQVKYQCGGISTCLKVNNSIYLCLLCIGKEPCKTPRGMKSLVSYSSNGLGWSDRSISSPNPLSELIEISDNHSIALKLKELGITTVESDKSGGWVVSSSKKRRFKSSRLVITKWDVSYIATHDGMVEFVLENGSKGSCKAFEFENETEEIP